MILLGSLQLQVSVMLFFGSIQNIQKVLFIYQLAFEVLKDLLEYLLSQQLSFQLLVEIQGEGELVPLGNLA